jgi:hypothetical protein
VFFHQNAANVCIHPTGRQDKLSTIKAVAGHCRLQNRVSYKIELNFHLDRMLISQAQA